MRFTLLIATPSSGYLSFSQKLFPHTTTVTTALPFYLFTFLLFYLFTLKKLRFFFVVSIILLIFAAEMLSLRRWHSIFSLVNRGVMLFSCKLRT